MRRKVKFADLRVGWVVYGDTDYGGWSYANPDKGVGWEVVTLDVVGRRGTVMCTEAGTRAELPLRGGYDVEDGVPDDPKLGEMSY